MTDDYESGRGLDPVNAADRLTDLDQDGQSNFAEFLAGTAPNNAASRLEITAATVNRDTGAYSLRWTSVPGRNYRVYASALPGADTGSSITPVFPAAAGATTTFSGTLGGPPIRQFFSVRVIP